VRDTAARLGTPKVYVATVMPGYDDTKTGRRNSFAVNSGVSMSGSAAARASSLKQSLKKPPFLACS
jgi:hypothetical protein